MGYLHLKECSGLMKFGGGEGVGEEGKKKLIPTQNRKNSFLHCMFYASGGSNPIQPLLVTLFISFFVFLFLGFY